MEISLHDNTMRIPIIQYTVMHAAWRNLTNAIHGLFRYNKLSRASESLHYPFLEQLFIEGWEQAFLKALFRVYLRN